MSALNIYLISGRIVSSVAFSCRFFQFQAREDTSQNESYYICLIREPWRDLWHGARRFKLFSFWMCQGQARQCKILQNLLLQRKKINFWDVYWIINSHAAMSGDLRWSQSFFQDLGYTEVNLSLQWQLLAAKPKLVLPLRCVLDQIVETHTEHPFPFCTSVKDNQENTRTPERRGSLFTKAVVSALCSTGSSSPCVFFRLSLTSLVTHKRAIPSFLGTWAPRGLLIQCFVILCVCVQSSGLHRL